RPKRQRRRRLVVRNRQCRGKLGLGAPIIAMLPQRQDARPAPELREPDRESRRFRVAPRLENRLARALDLAGAQPCLRQEAVINGKILGRADVALAQHAGLDLAQSGSHLAQDRLCPAAENEPLSLGVREALILGKPDEFVGKTENGLRLAAVYAMRQR